MRTLLLPPIVTLVSIAAMFALDRLWPVARLWSGPLAALGWPAVLGGLVMSQWHAALFRRLGTNLNTFGEREADHRGVAAGFVAGVDVGCWVRAVRGAEDAGGVRGEYEEYCRRVRRWV